MKSIAGNQVPHGAGCMGMPCTQGRTVHVDCAPCRAAARAGCKAPGGGAAEGRADCLPLAHPREVVRTSTHGTHR
eukprot:11224080-Lingulodinium_polyedra.AAC.1